MPPASTGNGRKAARRARLAIWLILTFLLTGCSGKEAPTSPETELIRAGGHSITLAQYERAFFAARIAYSDDRGTDPRLIGDARLRLLHQMTEELIVQCRADELGIVVDDQALTAAVDTVKKDYPDDEFERMLLESAIPFSLWKERLAVRLLMEKIVDQDLIASVTITPDDIEAYYRSHPEMLSVDDATVADADLRHRLIEQLRREKVETAWPQWIDGLKARYGVKINWELWEQSQGTDAGTGSREKEK